MNIIPYCTFDETPAGFNVRVKAVRPAIGLRILKILFISLFLWLGLIIGPFVFYFLFGWSSTLLFLAIWLTLFVLYAIRISTSKLTTDIEVTGDTVTIDGRQLQRHSLGPFGIAPAPITRMYLRSRKNYVVLNYSYSNESVAFGGWWSSEKAKEFVRALNYRLFGTDQQADAMTVSGLRSARTTDF